MIVFAGPNGAGKTTHAEHILRALGINTFVNADFIAKGLSGRQVETVAFEAGRIMLRRLRQLAGDGQDFGFESTLASRSFAPFLAGLRARGYRVSIYYFWLRSAGLAVKRVRMRVRLGGHDVPVDVIRRRFARSVANLFDLYLALAEEWTVFDNSGPAQSRQIASHNDHQTVVQDKESWKKLLQLASPKPSAP